MKNNLSRFNHQKKYLPAMRTSDLEALGPIHQSRLPTNGFGVEPCPPPLGLVATGTMYVNRNKTKWIFISNSLLINVCKVLCYYDMCSFKIHFLESIIVQTTPCAKFGELFSNA